MPKYAVYAVVTGTKWIGEFEADSPEAAEDMAADSEEAFVSVCCQCSSEIDQPEIASFVAEVSDE